MVNYFLDTQYLPQKILISSDLLLKKKFNIVRNLITFSIVFKNKVNTTVLYMYHVLLPKYK